MSVFAEFENLISVHVDEQFGDQITIKPLVQGEIKKSADPDRPAITVVGIVDLNSDTISGKGKEKHDGFQANIATEKVHVSFDTGVFSSPSQQPRQGDELSAIVEGVSMRFRVVTVEPDGLGRIVCPCKKLG